MLSPALTVLRGLVFPPVCEGCGAATGITHPDPACPSCDTAIRPIEPPACPRCSRHWPVEDICPSCRNEHPFYDSVTAAFSYEGPLRSILHAYKFGCRRAIGRYLGEKLSVFARQRLGKQAFDAVVAIPPAPGKAAERGFHPPRELARAVSRALHAPLRLTWLAARKGRAQTSLTRAERHRNILNRFYFRADPREADGRAVLLVDDVLTTGSTLSECARVLKDAGAASVTALCLARGDWR